MNMYLTTSGIDNNNTTGFEDEKKIAAVMADAVKAENTQWVIDATNALRELVVNYDDKYRFNIEDVRKKVLVREPNDLRLWGAVTKQALSQGIIYKTGQYGLAVSSNNSPKMLYRVNPAIVIKKFTLEEPVVAVAPAKQSLWSKVKSFFDA